jgi:ribosomal protein S18 acetylase RimI-like enzyme
METSELLHLADCNLTEFCREQARCLPPYKILERDHALFLASGTRFPTPPANCVLPLGDRVLDVPLLLAEARDFFDALERGFGVYAPAHLGPELVQACEANQWPRLSDAPGMVLAERVQPMAAGPGVELRTVRGETEADHFVAICAQAYESIGLPADVSRKLFSRRDRWQHRPYLQGQLVYEHERPVAAALLLFSHGIAGIYWVGTLPDARGRGHASLLMRSISNHAFDCGARCVVLQATPFGEPVYRRLGYREFTRYPWYLSAK